MTKIFCPCCGNAHSSNKRYCSFCGEDLEEIILDYKNKHLPIAFNNDKLKKAQPIDEWDERRQTVLKIKEKEKARERIARLKEQQRIAEFEKTRKRRKVPFRKIFCQARKRLEGKKTRKVPSSTLKWILRILIFLSIAGVFVTFILMLALFESEACDYLFLAFFITMGLSFILLIPVVIVESLTRSKGRALCYSESRYRSSPDFSGCANCADCGNCFATFGSLGFIISLVFLLFSKNKI